MDLLQVALLALSATCLVLFSYISLLLLSAYLKLRVKQVLVFSSAFLLLSLSQVAYVAAVASPSTRWSLTLSTISSSMASVAFFAMLMVLQRREEVVFAVPLIIAIPDLSAGSLSLVVSTLAKSRRLKAYTLALSLAYIFRGLGNLAVYAEIGVYMLVLSEVIKTVATLVYALYHVGKVIGYGEEEK